MGDCCVALCFSCRFDTIMFGCFFHHIPNMLVPFQSKANGHLQKKITAGCVWVQCLMGMIVYALIGWYRAVAELRYALASVYYFSARERALILALGLL